MAALSILIVLLTVVAASAAFLALWDWLAPETASLRRRLAEEFSAETKDEVAGSPLFKDLDRLVLGSARLPARGALAHGRRVHERLKDWLEQGGVALAPLYWLLLSASLGVLAGLGLAWFRGPILGAAGALLGSAGPWAVLLMRCNARREQMLKQLPGVFDLMARAIRAGQSVPQAMQSVSDGRTGPIAAEFARCQKQLNLGLAPDIAFGELADRTDIVEVRIFVMALSIQRQVGGSLGETMDRLAATVRSRLALRTQVRTLTAEGRLQGWTLVVLPFVLFAAMLVLNRPYAEALLEHGQLIALALAAMAVGILWIRRIVNFEI